MSFNGRPPGIAAHNLDIASGDHPHVTHIGVRRMCMEAGNPVWIDLERPETSSTGTIL